MDEPPAKRSRKVVLGLVVAGVAVVVVLLVVLVLSTIRRLLPDPPELVPGTVSSYEFTYHVRGSEHFYRMKLATFRQVMAEIGLKF